MPVYNEVDGISETLGSWVRALDALDITYELRIIDDGSTDGTAEAVAGVEGISVWSKANEGHGPTILRGYAEAVERAEWVFQADSDDEIPASALAAMWEARADHDAVLGVRVGREQDAVRKVMSIGAKWTVRLFYGGTLQDVNCPFRLMRASALAPVVERIPADTFAPNPVIAGALVRAGADIVEVEVPYQPRAAGAPTSLWKRTPRVFTETIRLAPRFRSSS